MLNSKSSCRCALLCLVVAAVMALPASVQAGMVGILVPAYFYPGTGGAGGSGDGWAELAAASATVPITAIFNPNSGPLPGLPDPNYVTALTNLENAGGHVVAYVATNYGSNSGSFSLANIESQINTYVSQYGNLIEGFLIDEMLITPSTLSYYQSIDTYIKGLSASYTVIGNPGQPYLDSGVTANEYLSTADVFNIFEGSNTDFNAYPDGQNWYQSYPSSRFSNIVHDASGVSAMLADVSKAAQYNAGYAYVTDQLGPTPSNPNANPYGQLPSYWNEEVAAVQDLLSVPEPGTLSYLASAALCWPLAIAARGRVRRRSRA